MFFVLSQRDNISPILNRLRLCPCVYGPSDTRSLKQENHRVLQYINNLLNLDCKIKSNSGKIILYKICTKSTYQNVLHMYELRMRSLSCQSQVQPNLLFWTFPTSQLTKIFNIASYMNGTLKNNVSIKSCFNSFAVQYF